MASRFHIIYLLFAKSALNKSNYADFLASKFTVAPANSNTKYLDAEDKVNWYNMYDTLKSLKELAK